MTVDVLCVVARQYVAFWHMMCSLLEIQLLSEKSAASDFCFEDWASISLQGCTEFHLGRQYFLFTRTCISVPLGPIVTNVFY